MQRSWRLTRRGLQFDARSEYEMNKYDQPQFECIGVMRSMYFWGEEPNVVATPVSEPRRVRRLTRRVRHSALSG